ncbi:MULTISPECIES: threonine-phosphate decarboxylase CobD [Marinobacter]|uniref:threonine-phosphate decarboxylase CobD n=1 Tax=Marinobacter TaxID=2742 RepID=UPI001CD9C0CE|nr:MULTISPECIES: threonine-phosphate decarboxylase CobD [Marinobacter]
MKRMLTAPEHGGRLRAAAEQWGIPLAEWLDLSTGINPHGWPVPVIPEEVWRRLPEPDDGLEGLLRHWLGATASAACIPVAGSQAAIMGLPRLRPPCRVGVPSPGYQEHGHCWAAAGHRVTGITGDHTGSGDESWLDDLDVLVWVNPNNPTGDTIEPERLLSWHHRLQRRGGWLIVDEAFMDATPAFSIGEASGRPGLVVMRSLGKFFGLAGVRAGAVAGDPDIVDRLGAVMGPWSVSGPARFVMSRVLADQQWQAATTERLHSDSQRLAEMLVRQGLGDSTGTALFRYVRHSRAVDIASEFASRGILVRVFDQPAALRLGLPGSESDWARLDQAMSLSDLY